MMRMSRETRSPGSWLSSKDLSKPIALSQERHEKTQEQATPEDRPRRRSMSENLSHKALVVGLRNSGHVTS